MLSVIADAALGIFISSLLNQYESKSRLTWHNGKIPWDEIWLKIGGDSFKIVLQVANLESPNSWENTFMICMVECKDSIKNLKKVLKPVKEQIDKLTNMTWNRKNHQVSLWGLWFYQAVSLWGLWFYQAVSLWGLWLYQAVSLWGLWFIKLFLFGDYDFIKLFLFGDYDFY